MASITARRTTAIRLRVLARQSQRAGWNTLARFAAGLIVLLVALDLLVSATVNRLITADPNGEGSSPPWRLALYDRAPRPDVLLLGSSRVQTGLNPTILRETVAPELGMSPQILNMGLVWGTPQVNYWLLKNWIRPDKQPSLIVYGASEYE